nr:MAG TPA: hypothetical protein [Caudoviricetes sp.]
MNKQVTSKLKKPCKSRVFTNLTIVQGCSSKLKKGR